MHTHKRNVLSIPLAVIAIIVLAACGPQEAEAPSPVPSEVEVEDREAPVGNAAPIEGSEYENVTIWVDQAETTGAAAGAEAGSLVLTLTIQNTGTETEALNLSSDDFILLTANGLELEAVIISDELLTPEIEAGESVTGTAEFSTLDVGSTYTLMIEGFEDILVDASLQPEPLD